MESYSLLHIGRSYKLTTSCKMGTIHLFTWKMVDFKSLWDYNSVAVAPPSSTLEICTCGGEPEQAANMHMNRVSFTLK